MYKERKNECLNGQIKHSKNREKKEIDEEKKQTNRECLNERKNEGTNE